MSIVRPARSTAIVIAASLSVATLAIGTPAQAQTCHPAMQGVGKGKLQQPIAEPRARENWRDNVGNKYGWQYAFWQKAQNPDMTCHHDGRRPALRQWTCVATAKPCK